MGRALPESGQQLWDGAETRTWISAVRKGSPGQPSKHFKQVKSWQHLKTGFWKQSLGKMHLRMCVCAGKHTGQCSWKATSRLTGEVWSLPGKHRVAMMSHSVIPTSFPFPGVLGVTRSCFRSRRARLSLRAARTAPPAGAAPQPQHSRAPSAAPTGR